MLAVIGISSVRGRRCKTVKNRLNGGSCRQVGRDVTMQGLNCIWGSFLGGKLQLEYLVGKKNRVLKLLAI